MIKRLIAITSTFPFGGKEPFLENEIDYMSSFDEVIFMPIYPDENVRSMNYPANVKWVPLKRVSNPYLLIIFSFFQILSKKIFYTELFDLIKGHKFSIRNIYYLLWMTSQGVYGFEQSYNIIQKNNYAKECDLYLYSYWMVEHAMIAAMLSDKIVCKKAFTRAHGYDIYEERNKGKYIPYRKYILSKLEVYPISNDGAVYLKKKYNKGVVKSSRLGTKNYGIGVSEKKDSSIRLLSCSWCVEVKRINLIIEALAKIVDIRIEWIHIGDGPLLGLLRELAKEQLNSNVDYQLDGKKTNQEIIEFYKENYVDLFVNVSSSEGIPVSIMEAMSFGIPVIATRVGGTPEIVENEYNGYLLRPDFKAEEFVSHIVKYSKMDNGERLKIRHNARLYWENNYSAQINYKNFFHEIVQ